jgi:phenylalanyl-tRNA synthetase beta chain
MVTIEVVSDDVPAGAVRDTIRESGGALLTSLHLFDVFRSDGLPPDTRSLTFALRLQSPDRTLTDDDVADVRTRIIEDVATAHAATLR